jgi:hypothetical protein
MPEWMQWVNQNPSWLSTLTAVVITLAGIALSFGFLRWTISKLWSAVRHRFRAELNHTPFNLQFIARDFPQTYWKDGKLGEIPITCVVARWYATNASMSGSIVPAQLLKPHLLRASPKTLLHAEVVTLSDEFANSPVERVIPEGQTRELIIHCHFSRAFKPRKRIKMRLVVEDQFENKYILPPIVVLSMLGGNKPDLGKQSANDR